jgi:hypothetical protein
VVEYFAYPEYTSGPKSPVTTGSMVAHEELILVRLHAVAQEDDGTMEARTVCDQPAFFNPQEENKIPWEKTNLASQCPKCRAEIDGQPVSGLTGKPVAL